MLTEQDPGPGNLQAWAATLALDVERLRGEVLRIQRALAEAEERQALVQRLLELDGEVPTPLPNSTDRLADSPNSGGTAPTKEALVSLPVDSGSPDSLEDAVAAILEASNKPLHISAIRARLVAESVPIPGRGDDANIIVRLRKAPERFTRTARGTYALTTWGLPSLDNSTLKRNRKQSRK